jgi:ribonuclease HI
VRVTIIADASWCPDTHAAGYAFWIASDRGKRGGSGAYKDRVVSSAVAEMMAVVNGLYTACKDGYVEEGDAVLLQTDCMRAIDMFHRRPIGMSEFEKPVVDYFEKLVKEVKITVQFRHVKGHTDGKQPRLYINNKCDEFAKRAMRTARAQFRKERNEK